MTTKFTSKSGLSLLELLVSLALMALIGAGLAGAFGMGTQVWLRTAALDEHRQEIALRGQLRRYMSQVLPPTRLTPFKEVFSGRSDSLSFITLAETPFAPEAAAMRMTLSRSEDELGLFVELLDDNSGSLRGWTDILARGVDQVSFEYWGSIDGSIGWHEEWGIDNALPDLIRIRLNEGTTPDWPEFTVRVLLQ